MSAKTNKKLKFSFQVSAEHFHENQIFGKLSLSACHNLESDLFLRAIPRKVIFFQDMVRRKVTAKQSEN